MERRLAAIMSADVVGYSRLIRADEGGTLAALKTLRSNLIEPKLAEHNGRVVKLMGDGMLAEFPSVVDAVHMAVEMQQAVLDRNAALPKDKRIVFRVGINIGDIVIDGEDIQGDGVNVAARLEGLAEPNGLCISGAAYEQIRDHTALQFEPMGEQHLKNIDRPVQVWRWIDTEPSAEQIADTVTEDQEVRFCTASDGVTLAYAQSGNGPPLVRAAHWFTHIEYEWTSPLWRHLLSELSAGHTLIRYDQRGTGLSDWECDEIGLDSWVDDLASVVDAVGLDQFALLGISQGCPISIRYAARYPERVSKLVLYGGYMKGWLVNGSENAIAQHEAMQTLLARGWGRDTAAIRRMFTSLFIPQGTNEDVAWFSQMQRISTSPEMGVRIYNAFPKVDVTREAEALTVPTLVMHCRDDAAVSYKAGRKMASSIPQARFVTLESEGHLLLEKDEAFRPFITELRRFLAPPGN